MSTMSSPPLLAEVKFTATIHQATQNSTAAAGTSMKTTNPTSITVAENCKKGKFRIPPTFSLPSFNGGKKSSLLPSTTIETLAHILCEFLKLQPFCKAERSLSLCCSSPVVTELYLVSKEEETGEEFEEYIDCTVCGESELAAFLPSFGSTSGGGSSTGKDANGGGNNKLQLRVVFAFEEKNVGTTSTGASSVLPPDTSGKNLAGAAAGVGRLAGAAPAATLKRPADEGKDPERGQLEGEGGEERKEDHAGENAPGDEEQEAHQPKRQKNGDLETELQDRARKDVDEAMRKAEAQIREQKDKSNQEASKRQFSIVCRTLYGGEKIQHNAQGAPSITSGRGENTKTVYRVSKVDDHGNIFSSSSDNFEGNNINLLTTNKTAAAASSSSFVNATPSPMISSTENKVISQLSDLKLAICKDEFGEEFEKENLIAIPDKCELPPGENTGFSSECANFCTCLYAKRKFLDLAFDRAAKVSCEEFGTIWKNKKKGSTQEKGEREEELNACENDEVFPEGGERRIISEKVRADFSTAVNEDCHICLGLLSKPEDDGTLIPKNEDVDEIDDAGHLVRNKSRKRTTLDKQKSLVVGGKCRHFFHYSCLRHKHLDPHFRFQCPVCKEALELIQDDEITKEKKPPAVLIYHKSAKAAGGAETGNSSSATGFVQSRQNSKSTTEENGIVCIEGRGENAAEFPRSPVCHITAGMLFPRDANIATQMPSLMLPTGINQDLQRKQLYANDLIRGGSDHNHAFFDLSNCGTTTSPVLHYCGLHAHRVEQKIKIEVKSLPIAPRTRKIEINRLYIQNRLSTLCRQIGSEIVEATPELATAMMARRIVLVAANGVPVKVSKDHRVIDILPNQQKLAREVALVFEYEQEPRIEVDLFAKGLAAPISSMEQLLKLANKAAEKMKKDDGEELDEEDQADFGAAAASSSSSNTAALVQFSASTSRQCHKKRRHALELYVNFRRSYTASALPTPDDGSGRAKAVLSYSDVWVPYVGNGCFLDGPVLKKVDLAASTSLFDAATNAGNNSTTSTEDADGHKNREKTKEAYSHMLSVLQCMQKKWKQVKGLEAGVLSALFRSLLDNWNPAADALHLLLTRREKQITNADLGALVSGLIYVLQKTTLPRKGGFAELLSSEEMLDANEAQAVGFMSDDQPLTTTDNATRSGSRDVLKKIPSPDCLSNVKYVCSALIWLFETLKEVEAEFPLQEQVIPSDFFLDSATAKAETTAKKDQERKTSKSPAERREKAEEDDAKVEHTDAAQSSSDSSEDDESGPSKAGAAGRLISKCIFRKTEFPLTEQVVRAVEKKLGKNHVKASVIAETDEDVDMDMVSDDHGDERMPDHVGNKIAQTSTAPSSVHSRLLKLFGTYFLQQQDDLQTSTTNLTHHRFLSLASATGGTAVTTSYGRNSTTSKHVHPIFELKSAKAALNSAHSEGTLTLNPKGRVVVCRGRPPCDAGANLLLFDPIAGEELSFGVAILTAANAKRGTTIGVLSDKREVQNDVDLKEGIACVVDSSYSMSESSGFGRRERDEVERNYDSKRANGWDEDPPEDDDEDRLSEELEKFGNHPNLFDFRSVIERSGDKRKAAECILQELCRLTWVKTKDPDAEDRRRVFTKHREKFIRVLLLAAKGGDGCTGRWNNSSSFQRITRHGNINLEDDHEGDADASTSEVDVVPHMYLCPITRELLEDPVIAPDEFTYSRHAIETWLERSKKSPMTGIDMGKKKLMANKTLRIGLEEWKEARERRRNGQRGWASNGGSGASSSSAVLVNNITGNSNSFRATSSSSSLFGKNVLGTTSMLSTENFSDDVFVKMQTTGKTCTIRCNVRTTTVKEFAALVNEKQNSLLFPIDPARMTFSGADRLFSTSSDGSLALLTFGVRHAQTLTMFVREFGFGKNYMTTSRSATASGANKRKYDLIDVEIAGLEILPGGNNGLQKMDICDVPANATVEHVLLRAWCQCIHFTGKYDLANGQRFSPPSGWDLWCFSSSESDADHEKGDGVKVRYGQRGEPEGKFVGMAEDGGRSYVSSSHEDRSTALDASTLKGFEIMPRKLRSWEKREMTRMQAVVQFFNAFCNRSIAYNYPAAVGLCPFSTEVPDVEDINVTVAYEDFREEVDDLKPGGDTALYDALLAAAEALVEWKKKIVAQKKQALQGQTQSSGGNDHQQHLQGTNSNKMTAKEADALTNVGLRLICFSDGKDSSSESEPYEVAQYLQKHKISMDLIMIGSERDRDENAHAIAKASGGYVFRPKTLQHGLQIMELETMLFGGERPMNFEWKQRRGLPLVKDEDTLSAFTNLVRFPVDRCDQSIVPARRQPQELEQIEGGSLKVLGVVNKDSDSLEKALDHMVTGNNGGLEKNNGNANKQDDQKEKSSDTSAAAEDDAGAPGGAKKLSKAMKKAAGEMVNGKNAKHNDKDEKNKDSKKNSNSKSGAASANATQGKNQDSGAATPKPPIQQQVDEEARKRLLVEVRALSRRRANQNPQIDIYPTELLHFWKVVMQGPDSSAYQGGVFELYVKFPPDYPGKPPEIRFTTPIKHCNVNAHGKICHSILDRNWNRDRTASEALNHVYGLLMSPDYDDPLDSVLALQARTDHEAYQMAIRKHVAEHAKGVTREELRKKLTEGGE
ncbi:unnamed protein product [Amoebophrya sp. A120]|nr:unnamed protein product [Amoebophrya sp. A120]|eukprot:GSA120T00024963001.1